MQEAFALGLLRRRQIALPTGRACLLLLAVFAGTLWIFLVRIQSFLADNRPAGGEVLVVEGWIPDYAVRQALVDFRARRYSLILTTGGLMPQGMACSAFHNYADFAADMLKTFGLGADSVAAVPSLAVEKDRTYQEGLSAKAWLTSHGKVPASVDLYSFSTHARRSRLLFQKAFGPGTRVGVFAPADVEYDPKTWWRTSNGVRRVSDECIAYLYAVLIFGA